MKRLISICDGCGLEKASESSSMMLSPAPLDSWAMLVIGGIHGFELCDRCLDKIVGLLHLKIEEPDGNGNFPMPLGYSRYRMPQKPLQGALTDDELTALGLKK